MCLATDGVNNVSIISCDGYNGLLDEEDLEGGQASRFRDQFLTSPECNKSRAVGGNGDLGGASLMGVQPLLEEQDDLLHPHHDELHHCDHDSVLPKHFGMSEEDYDNGSYTQELLKVRES